MLSSKLKSVVNHLDSNPIQVSNAIGNSPKVSINKLTGKAGAFYERVRYLIDYREAHTIRRNALERILLRQIRIQGTTSAGMALIEEMISGGYLPNDAVPESTARSVQYIINKYLDLRQELFNSGRLTPRVSRTIISFAATEIDYYLFPDLKIDELVVGSMFDTLVHRVQCRFPIHEHELHTQVYIACRKTLLRNDKETLLYWLWVKNTPAWQDRMDAQMLSNVSANFIPTIDALRNEIDKPLNWQLVSKFKNQAIYFSIINHIFKKHGRRAESVLSSEAQISLETSEFLKERYETEIKLVKKSGIRAIFYIFLTKVLIGLLIELPYEKYFLGEINYLSLGVNATFHPILLFLITRGITAPGQANTQRIVDGVVKISRGEQIEPIHIKSPDSGGFALLVFNFIYLILFAITFGIIGYILVSINFNPVSIGLFLLFLTLVSYFGLRIRRNAKQWKVDTKDEGTLSLLWSLFTLPIVRTGRWLSIHFSSINVFVFIMDFLIEAPFKIVLKAFDSFINFLRDSKEDAF